MRATAKDLRIKSKMLLDAVDRGEHIIITHRGRLVAKLSPIEGKASKQSNKNTTEEDPLDTIFGIWSNRKDTENVTDYVRKLRKGRKLCSSIQMYFSGH